MTSTRSGVSLRGRLLGVVAALALVLLAVIVVTSLASSSLSTAVDRRLDVIYPATSALGQVHPEIVDLESSERGYVATKDASFLEPYQSGQQTVSDGLDQLRSYADEVPGLGDGVDRTRADLQVWLDQFAGPEIAATQADHQLQGLRMIATGDGGRQFDVVRADLDALEQLMQNSSSANQHQAERNQQAVRLTLIVGLVAVVGLTGALAVLLTRWVTRPTDALVDRVQEVAEGDFRRPVEVDGPPEFGAIAIAVDTMRRRILTELDELGRYNEALDQSGPVVQRLRAELEADQFTPPPGIEVAGRVLAAEGLLAGDFYDLVMTPAGGLAVLVADVSGHGHEAGVLAIRFKFLVEAALQLGDDPTRALGWAAEQLGDTGDMFLTCALAVIDPAAGTVTFLSAGHSPGVLIHGDEPDPVELSSTGPLIGPFVGRWRAETHLLSGTATTTVALCSDGLLEARASADELFGFDRFGAIVRDSRTVAQIVDDCCAAARDHAGERLADDLTVVAVRVQPPPAAVTCTAVGRGMDRV